MCLQASLKHKQGDILQERLRNLRDMVDTHILVRNWFASHERKLISRTVFHFPLKSVIPSGEEPCQFIL